MFGIKPIPSVLLVAGAVLALALQAEGILNCESTYSIEAAYKACLHNEGIDFKVMDHTSASLEDALVSEHADTFCSHPRENYVQAMECIGGITRQCMPESYQYLVPLPEEWGQMAVRVCDHIDDLDLVCAAAQSHANKVCGEREAHQYVEERGLPSKDDLHCWTFEAEFDCVMASYSSCNCMTAKVYSDIILDIMMPSTCSEKVDLEHRRLSCPSDHQSTTSTPLPALPDQVTADCQSVSSLKSKVVQCFTNEEIQDQDLFTSFVNSPSPPQSLIETLFLRYGDAACSSHRLRYDEAFRCTLQLLRDCTPSEFQKYLPSPNTASAHIQLLCDHRKEIDLFCASQKSAALYSCGQRKGMNYAQSGDYTTDGLYCFAFKADFECNQEVFKACGCMTAKFYSDLSLDLHYPKTCPRDELESKRLSCQNPAVGQPVVKVEQPSVGDGGLPGVGDEVRDYTDSAQCMQAKKEDIRRCYTDRGFTYIETSQTTSSHIFYGSILDTIMKDNFVCANRKLPSARAAVSCEAEILHFCTPVSAKASFSDPYKLVEILDSLCDRWNDIDDDVCAYDQLSKIGHCYHSASTDDYNFYDVESTYRDTCSHYRKLGDCAKDTLLTCGCRTAQVFSDTIFNVMLPAECRSSEDAPRFIQCDENNPYIYKHEDKDRSGAGRLPYPLWSLAVALCIATLFRRFM